MNLKIFLGLALCACVQTTWCMKKNKIHPHTPQPQTRKKTTVPQGAFEKFCTNMDSLMLRVKNKEIAQEVLKKAGNKKRIERKKTTAEQEQVAKKLIEAYITAKHIDHLKRITIKELTKEAMFKHIPAITKLVIQGLAPQNKPIPTYTRNVTGVPRH